MRSVAIALVVGLAFMSQGCAIVVRGDRQDVSIRSQVPDTHVEVDGVALKLSDVANAGSNCAAGVIELDRNRVHEIRAQAPGYDPLVVIVYPAMSDDWLFAEQCTMWPILWLPMAIDLNSGALNDLPETIDLPLVKSKEPVTAQGPSATANAAEIRETKIVIRKQPPPRESLRECRTSRMSFDDGY